MKCVCGFEGEVNSTILNITDGFDKTNLRVKISKNGNYGYYEVEECVYICPKCGTLKIEI